MMLAAISCISLIVGVFTRSFDAALPIVFGPMNVVINQQKRHRGHMIYVNKEEVLTIHKNEFVDIDLYHDAAIRFADSGTVSIEGHRKRFLKVFDYHIKSSSSALIALAQKVKKPNVLKFSFSRKKAKIEFEVNEKANLIMFNKNGEFVFDAGNQYVSVNGKNDILLPGAYKLNSEGRFKLIHGKLKNITYTQSDNFAQMVFKMRPTTHHATNGNINRSSKEYSLFILSNWALKSATP